MTYYEEKFQSHELHQNIIKLKSELENLTKDLTDNDALEHSSKILKLVTLIETTLANVDAELVQWNSLNSINKNCKGIIGDINNFNNEKAISHLEGAGTTKSDAIVSLLAQLPTIIPHDDPEFKKDALSNISKNISEILKRNNQKAEEFSDTLSQLDTETRNLGKRINEHLKNLESQKSRLDEAITQFQTQFSEAEDRRREDFNNRLNTFNTENTEFKKIFQNEIQGYKTDSFNEIKSSIDNFQKESKEIQVRYEDIFKNLSDGFKSDADKTKDYLLHKKDEAKRLLDIIANIGVTGNYNKIASEEKKTADWLRIFSVLFMSIGIILIVSFVLNFSAETFDWKILLSRVGVTIALFIPAFYLAKESSRHRQREMHNRKMELELASIGPYTELLPDDQKNELKAKLTEKFFGQPEVIEDKKNTVSSNALFSLIERITTTLAKSK